MKAHSGSVLRSRVPQDNRFDYIIISSKSQDTLNICREFASLIRNTQTVSLQNGIGNEEIISGFTDRVIGGMIITGFEWRDDAVVHVSVEAGPMMIGRFPDGLMNPLNGSRRSWEVPASMPERAGPSVLNSGARPCITVPSTRSGP